MSFGAGHMQDMNNRMKQNRANRPSSREKFKGKNREIVHTKGNGGDERPHFIEVSQKELIEVRRRIQIKA